MITNSTARDNPGFIIDYNVTSSSCAIRKIRFCNRITDYIDPKKRLFDDKLERAFFPIRYFIIS